MAGVIGGVEQRGAGMEIRIYGLDPDLAEARALEHGHHVLVSSLDKPHGLRCAVSSVRAFTSSCPAWRSRADASPDVGAKYRDYRDIFAINPAAHPILTI